MRKRNKIVVVHYREDELNRVEDLVRYTPYCREEFIRRATLGAKICEKVPAEYGRILMELRRIGSNVDQLLVKARSLNFIDQVSLQRIKEEVRQMDELFLDSFGDNNERRH